jgi:hypothetical protein
MSLEHRPDRCFVLPLLSEFLFHVFSRNAHLYLHSDIWGFASLMRRLDPHFRLTWRGLPFVSCVRPTHHLPLVMGLAEE